MPNAEGPADAFFVTGTDTEVGKTFATCALVMRARQAGLAAVAIKPVAAGIEADGQNADVAALRAANAVPLPETTLNPYRLAPPIAPHLAAREAGLEIRFAPIVAALADARRRAPLVFVEGAGGFRIPLGPDGDSADLAVALGLPVILVVGLRLGCINHALLSVEAILARGLCLHGWVANAIDPHMARADDNFRSLTALLPAACLGRLPHLATGAASDAARHLQWPAGEAAA
jgi:dethiobiotin synthetase